MANPVDFREYTDDPIKDNRRFDIWCEFCWYYLMTNNYETINQLYDDLYQRSCPDPGKVLQIVQRALKLK